MRSQPNTRLGLRSGARMLVALLGLVAMTSCLSLNVEAPGSQPSDPATEKFDPGLNIDISKMQRTPSGVYYKDGPLGTGATLAGLGTVVVSYVGYVKSGAKFQQGSGVQISLANEIIGIQEGLQGMHEGGERLLVIPSALGFGSNYSSGVPPNSTLIYDIILNSIQ